MVNLIANGVAFNIGAKKTGNLMFKFDDDEPQVLASIYDYGKFIIELQQRDVSENGLYINSPSIEFTAGGKKFKLYIEKNL